MEDKLKQEIKEYLKENLKIDIDLDERYEMYCSTSSVDVTVSLLLEDEKISESTSQSFELLNN